MIRFPQDFTWGAATSCYQIEGAWLEGGKGLSIWDAFCHIPGKIAHGHTGDVAIDHYHKYKQDVALMKDMGLKAYRFSISWPRIQPCGTGKANPEGIRFYSNLIDELLKNDIIPWLALHHWDLPLALQMEYDGWLNPRLSEFFRDYAGICFEHFGDRVKNWITFNEPWVISILGYGQGVFAPGRTSNAEPYLAAHQLLRSHGMAVELYREKFHHQNGRIGIANNCDWREPLTDSEKDKAAAQRALEFYLGWFADPIYSGDYPAEMRRRVNDRLPKFTDKDRARIKNSSDFFGLNHYTTTYAADAGGKKIRTEVYGNSGIAEDQDVQLSSDSGWEKSDMGWNIVPWGCRKLLEWIDARYGRPEIVITENGCALPDRVEDGAVHDIGRIDFLKAYISECHKAIQEGIDLTGYFVWSMMDNFEWALGYGKRFGIHYVDYASGRRIPKDSARWYAELMGNNGF